MTADNAMKKGRELLLFVAQYSIVHHLYISHYTDHVFTLLQAPIMLHCIQSNTRDVSLMYIVPRLNALWT